MYLGLSIVHNCVFGVQHAVHDGISGIPVQVNDPVFVAANQAPSTSQHHLPSSFCVPFVSACRTIRGDFLTRRTTTNNASAAMMMMSGLRRNSESSKKNSMLLGEENSSLLPLPTPLEDPFQHDVSREIDYDDNTGKNSSHTPSNSTTPSGHSLLQSTSSSSFGPISAVSLPLLPLANRWVVQYLVPSTSGSESTCPTPALSTPTRTTNSTTTSFSALTERSSNNEGGRVDSSGLVKEHSVVTPVALQLMDHFIVCWGATVQSLLDTLEKRWEDIWFQQHPPTNNTTAHEGDVDDSEEIKTIPADTSIAGSWDANYWNDPILFPSASSSDSESPSATKAKKRNLKPQKDENPVKILRSELDVAYQDVVQRILPTAIAAMEASEVPIISPLCRHPTGFADSITTIDDTITPVANSNPNLHITSTVTATAVPKNGPNLSTAHLLVELPVARLTIDRIAERLFDSRCLYTPNTNDGHFPTTMQEMAMARNPFRQDASGLRAPQKLSLVTLSFPIARLLRTFDILSQQECKKQHLSECGELTTSTEVNDIFAQDSTAASTSDTPQQQQSAPQNSTRRLISTPLHFRSLDTSSSADATELSTELQAEECKQILRLLQGVLNDAALTVVVATPAFSPSIVKTQAVHTAPKKKGPTPPSSASSFATAPHAASVSEMPAAAAAVNNNSISSPPPPSDSSIHIVGLDARVSVKRPGGESLLWSEHRNPLTNASVSQQFSLPMPHSMNAAAATPQPASLPSTRSVSPSPRLGHTRHGSSSSVVATTGSGALDTDVLQQLTTSSHVELRYILRSSMNSGKKAVENYMISLLPPLLQQILDEDRNLLSLKRPKELPLSCHATMFVGNVMPTDGSIVNESQRIPDDKNQQRSGTPPLQLQRQRSSSILGKNSADKSQNKHKLNHMADCGDSIGSTKQQRVRPSPMQHQQLSHHPTHPFVNAPELDATLSAASHPDDGVGIPLLQQHFTSRVTTSLSEPVSVSTSTATNTTGFGPTYAGQQLPTVPPSPNKQQLPSSVLQWFPSPIPAPLVDTPPPQRSMVRRTLSHPPPPPMPVQEDGLYGVLPPMYAAPPPPSLMPPPPPFSAGSPSPLPPPVYGASTSSLLPSPPHHFTEHPPTPNSGVASRDHHFPLPPPAMEQSIEQRPSRTMQRASANRHPMTTSESTSTLYGTVSPVKPPHAPTSPTAEMTNFAPEEPISSYPTHAKNLLATLPSEAVLVMQAKECFRVATEVAKLQTYITSLVPSSAETETAAATSAGKKKSPNNNNDNKKTEDVQNIRKLIVRTCFAASYASKLASRQQEQEEALHKTIAPSLSTALVEAVQAAITGLTAASTKKMMTSLPVDKNEDKAATSAQLFPLIQLDAYKKGNLSVAKSVDALRELHGYAQQHHQRTLSSSSGNSGRSSSSSPLPPLALAAMVREQTQLLSKRHTQLESLLQGYTALIVKIDEQLWQHVNIKEGGASAPFSAAMWTKDLFSGRLFEAEGSAWNELLTLEASQRAVASSNASARLQLLSTNNNNSPSVTSVHSRTSSGAPGAGLPPKAPTPSASSAMKQRKAAPSAISTSNSSTNVNSPRSTASSPPASEPTVSPKSTTTTAAPSPLPLDVLPPSVATTQPEIDATTTTPMSARGSKKIAPVPQKTDVKNDEPQVSETKVPKKDQATRKEVVVPIAESQPPAAAAAASSSPPMETRTKVEEDPVPAPPLPPPVVTPTPATTTTTTTTTTTASSSGNKYGKKKKAPTVHTVPVAESSTAPPVVVPPSTPPPTSTDDSSNDLVATAPHAEQQQPEKPPTVVNNTNKKRDTKSTNVIEEPIATTPPPAPAPEKQEPTPATTTTTAVVDADPDLVPQVVETNNDHGNSSHNSASLKTKPKETTPNPKNSNTNNKKNSNTKNNNPAATTAAAAAAAGKQQQIQQRPPVHLSSQKQVIFAAVILVMAAVAGVIFA